MCCTHGAGRCERTVQGLVLLTILLPQAPPTPIHVLCPWSVGCRTTVLSWPFLFSDLSNFLGPFVGLLGLLGPAPILSHSHSPVLFPVPSLPARAPALLCLTAIGPHIMEMAMVFVKGL